MIIFLSYLIIFIDDHILSTLCLFLINFGNGELDPEAVNDSDEKNIRLKIGGIGDVCTLPEVVFQPFITFFTTIKFELGR